jgi:hypothetical protein
MGTAEFRPAIWSANIIVNVEKALVFRNFVNTDYEGEITAAGQSVNINEIGDINVNDYTEGTDMTVQRLTGAQRKLIVDQQKYFNFGVDSIERRQARGNLIAAATQKAGFAIADTIDQFIAAKYTDAGITTSGLGTSSSSLSLYSVHSSSASNLAGFFSRVNRYMDQANCPSMGRWIVIPPWLHSWITYSQLSDDLTVGNMAGITPLLGTGNGFVGSLAGLAIYASNNVSTNGSTQWRVMFGTNDAISYAGQITEIKSGPIEKQFGEFVAGLYVYGAKVVRPDRLGVAYVDDAGLST